jgi:hypothetical protein
MTPNAGPAGGLVGIVLANAGSNVTVTLNGQPVNATSSVSGANTLVQFTVPQGATSGPVQVTTSTGTVLNAGTFTIQ